MADLQSLFKIVVQTAASGSGFADAQAQAQKLQAELKGVEAAAAKANDALARKPQIVDSTAPMQGPRLEDGSWARQEQQIKQVSAATRAYQEQTNAAAAKMLATMEAEQEVEARSLSLLRQREALATTLVEAEEAAAAGRMAEAAALEAEVAVMTEALAIQRATSLSEEEATALAQRRIAARELEIATTEAQAALNAELVAQESALLALEAERAEVGLLVGVQLGKARAEATTLARELATGVASGRTFSALAGSLGPALGVASVAALVLYELASSTVEGYFAAKEAIAQQAEALNGLAEKWREIRENVQQGAVLEKLSSSIDEQIKLLDSKIAKLKEGFVDRVAGDISGGMSNFDIEKIGLIRERGQMLKEARGQAVMAAEAEKQWQAALADPQGNLERYTQMLQKLQEMRDKMGSPSGFSSEDFSAYEKLNKDIATAESQVKALTAAQKQQTSETERTAKAQESQQEKLVAALQKESSVLEIERARASGSVELVAKLEDQQAVYEKIRSLMANGIEPAQAAMIASSEVLLEREQKTADAVERSARAHAEIAAQQAETGQVVRSRQMDAAKQPDASGFVDTGTLGNQMAADIAAKQQALAQVIAEKQREAESDKTLTDQQRADQMALIESYRQYKLEQIETDRQGNTEQLASLQKQNQERQASIASQREQIDVQREVNAESEIEAQIAAIKSDPNLSEAQRIQKMIPLLIQERAALQRNIEIWRAYNAANGGSSDLKTQGKVASNEGKIIAAQQRVATLTAQVNGGLLTKQQTQLDSLIATWGSLGQQVDGFFTNTLNTGINAAAQGIAGLITHTGNWRQSFANAAQGILQDIIKVGLQYVAHYALVGALRLADSIAASATKAKGTAETIANNAAQSASSATTGLLNSIASYGAAAVVGAAAFAAAMALAGGFESGGYTGDGGRKQVAGVVHGQEFVISAPAVKHYGRNFLENINARQAAPMPITKSSGGAISARGGSSGGGSAKVIVVDDGRQAKRLLGTKEFRGAVVQNVSKNRAAAGLRRG